MRLLFASMFLVGYAIGEIQDNGNPFKLAYNWIDVVNNDPESTWTAGENFDPNTPLSYIDKLLGTIIDDSRDKKLPLNEPITDIDNARIPKYFDARKKWRKCKSLKEIRDQGNCGSCWAVATSSAFTDRLCIATKAKWNGQLSAREVTSCCSYCGRGCNGGFTSTAWLYFRNNGLVSGGDYNTTKGCQPYPIQPCEHHTQGPLPSCPSLGDTGTPKCQKKCTNSKYSTPFSTDHKKGKKAYMVPFNEKEIQKEIMSFGPAAASFIVYDDFLSYKKGVYKRNPQSTPRGGHAVKLIGWGQEKGTKYWLVQNSWNTHWGDKGLFKIIRGTNECGFEQRISAGLASKN